MRISKKDIIIGLGLNKKLSNFGKTYGFADYDITSDEINGLSLRIQTLANTIDLLATAMGYEYNSESTNPPCFKKKILRGK